MVTSLGPLPEASLTELGSQLLRYQLLRYSVCSICKQMLQSEHFLYFHTLTAQTEDMITNQQEKYSKEHSSLLWIEGQTLFRQHFKAPVESATIFRLWFPFKATLPLASMAHLSIVAHAQWTQLIYCRKYHLITVEDNICIVLVCIRIYALKGCKPISPGYFITHSTNPVEQQHTHTFWRMLFCTA